jgi:hypothetical protein
LLGNTARNSSIIATAPPAMAMRRVPEDSRAALENVLKRAAASKRRLKGH